MSGPMDIESAVEKLASTYEQQAKLFRFLGKQGFFAGSASGASGSTAAPKRKRALSPDTEGSLSDGKPAAKKTRVKVDKAPRDPDRPKKPITSYLSYQNDIRKHVKEQHPDKPWKELCQMIGQRWQTMSDTDKEKWNKRHTEAQAKYDIQMEEYHKTHPEEAEKVAKKTAAAGRAAEKRASAAKPATPKAIVNGVKPVSKVAPSTKEPSSKEEVTKIQAELTTLAESSSSGESSDSGSDDDDDDDSEDEPEVSHPPQSIKAPTTKAPPTKKTQHTKVAPPPKRAPVPEPESESSSEESSGEEEEEEETPPPPPPPKIKKAPKAKPVSTKGKTAGRKSVS